MTPLVSEDKVLHNGKDLFMLLTGEDEQWVSAEKPVEVRR